MASNASDEAETLLPLIGLSTYVDRARYGAWDEVAAILPYTYVRSVSRAGGCAVLLPPAPGGPGDRRSTAGRAEAVLAALDGLVVTGGPDVDPRLYGALPHSETDAPRVERDAWEIALCRGALERELPLLAICRGLQVLNVSLDGTLHQHLPDVLGSDAHRATPGQMTANRVTLTAGSAVASILGAEAEGQLPSPPGDRPARSPSTGCRLCWRRHRGSDRGAGQRFCHRRPMAPRGQPGRRPPVRSPGRGRLPLPG